VREHLSVVDPAPPPLCLVGGLTPMQRLERIAIRLQTLEKALRGDNVDPAQLRAQDRRGKEHRSSGHAAARASD
jgi:hypothetical protein